MTSSKSSNSWKNNPIYKLYPPVSQTTYKKYTTTTVKVSKLYRDGKKIVTCANAGMALSSTLSGIAAVTPGGQEAAAIAAVSGGGCYLLGAYANVRLNSYKKLLKNKKLVRYKQIVYFKWTYPKLLQYRWKTKSYYQYKRNGKWKRCSAISITEWNDRAHSN